MEGVEKISPAREPSCLAMAAAFVPYARSAASAFHFRGILAERTADIPDPNRVNRKCVSEYLPNLGGVGLSEVYR